MSSPLTTQNGFALYSALTTLFSPTFLGWFPDQISAINAAQNLDPGNAGAFYVIPALFVSVTPNAISPAA